MTGTRYDASRLVCVYRRVNARHVAALLPYVDSAALWALDDVAIGLADVTHGQGPGQRVELLNRLLATTPRSARFTIIADDDLVFARGRTLADFLSYVRRYGFDLAQPAHTWLSHASYPFTRRRPWLAARQTTFVEIGPLVAFTEKAATALLPMPEDTGMGWGIDVKWSVEHRDSLRFGIVDATPISHVGKVAAAYGDSAREWRQRDELMRSYRVARMRDLQRTVRRYPVLSLPGVTP